MNRTVKKKSLIEEFYNALFDSSGDAVVIENELQEIVEASDRAAALLGYTREELLAKKTSDMQVIEPGQELDIYRQPSAGEVTIIERTLRRKDGTLLEAELSIVPVVAKGGNYFISVVRDVTARRSMEDALRESEHQSRATLDALADGIYVIDQNYKIRLVNRSLTKWLSDLELDNEVLGKGQFEAFPYFPEKVAGEYRKVFETGAIVHSEDVIYIGKRRLVLVTRKIPLLDDDRVTRIITVIRDVTAQREAQLLQEAVYQITGAVDSSRNLAELYARVHQIIVKVMPAGNFYIALYDDEKDLVSFPYFVDENDEPSPPHKPDRGLTEYVLRTGKSLLATAAVDMQLQLTGEVELVGKPSPIWLGVPLKIGGRSIGVMAVQDYEDPNAYGNRERDMLEFVSGQVAKAIERRRNLDLLRQSESRYRAIFESLQDIYFRTDRKGDILILSPSIRQYGWEASELLGRNISAIYPDTRKLQPLFRTLVRRGRVSDYEMKVAHRSGAVILVSLTAHLVRDETGRVTGMEGLLRNISRRKRAEEAVRESESKYRNIIENSLEGIYIVQDGILQFCNQRFADMFGYSSPEEMMGLGIQEFVADNSWAVVGEEIRLRVEGRQQISHYNFIARRQDGKNFEVETLGSRIEYKGRIAIQGVMRDVSEHRALEEQLRHSQRMEAVGRLAGGIAHDFNNLLTVITGNAEIAMMDKSLDGSVKDRLTEIRKASDRAADLTRQLLAFSRKQALAPKVLNLNTIIDNSKNLLTRLIGEDIELVATTHDEIWNSRVDPTQMEQVIINLAVNSRDAMPDGGKLILETSNLKLDEDSNQFHPEMVPGAYVMLSITDTGVGMSENVKAHIFDPFFTTKEVGKGTGLGLSTVYGIIKQSGGYIYVYSELDLGTTFKILLPAVFEEVEAESKAEQVKIPGGSESILVVEDDRGVLSLTCNFLINRGYNVMQASNGAEALALCNAMEKPMDLVLSDIVMPEMGGVEFVEKLSTLERWKDIKVLFMSGYATDAVTLSGILAAGFPYLQKPFQLNDLAARVREVLDEPMSR